MSVLRATALLGVIAFAAPLAGCQTISEEGCRAGNWEDIGFKDGSEGRSRTRLSKIGEDCAEYGITPDREAYITGLEQGLARYCSPEQGYEDGFDNKSLNTECRNLNFADYIDAHADGYEDYLILQDYAALQDRWQVLEKRILDLEISLDDAELSTQERRKRRARLRDTQNERDDVRADVRQMEDDFDWPRWRPVIEDSKE